MGRTDTKLSLEQAQKYGRRCFSCGISSKAWSHEKQKKCDTCIAGKNVIQPSNAWEKYLNGSK
jgi:hypothetical protein